MPDTPTISETDLLARIAELESQLAVADRRATLGTLTGSLAHEINNILTPVLNYAQMAMDDPADEAMARKAIRHALEAATRGSRITDSLLGLARSGDSAHRADVATAVDGALACLVRSPQQDGIEVSIDIEPGLTVAMDPVSLQQVLLNLLMNARNVMQDSGGRIEIRARSTWNTSGSGGEALIEVEDSGPGIEPALVSQIFRPFRTGLTPPGSRSDSRPVGTGLGLPICRQLVEGVGGQIEVDSVVGEGSVFRVSVPALREARAA